MDKRQARLWQRHYKFMEGVPPHGIMMSYLYGALDSHRVAEFGGSFPRRQDASCGSAACVAGWLPVSIPRHFEAKDGGMVLLKKTSSFWKRGYSCHWTTAVTLIFGIDEHHRDYACDPGFYHYAESEPTKRDVLTHMRRVARAYGWDITGDEPVRVKPRVIDELPGLVNEMNPATVSVRAEACSDSYGW